LLEWPALIRKLDAIDPSYREYFSSPEEAVMTGLSALWLPILVSSVIVFVASTVIHMALPWWHKGDYPKVPNEDRLRDALRPLAVPPGDYMVPRPANMKEMRTP